MNNSEYLINVIKRHIPAEILDYTFCELSSMGNLRPTLRWALDTHILKGWILQDINVLAGVEYNIRLDRVPSRMVENRTLYEIPLSMTGGRDITNVISVGEGLERNYGRATVGGTGNVDLVTTSKVRLVGPNVIIVDGASAYTNLALRCMVTHDPDFQSMHIRVLKFISTLCVHATKAYIHTNTIIRKGQAPIINGVALGGMGEIIESYSDAIEIYDDLITSKWSKINLMMDDTSHRRLINTYFY